MTVVAEQTFAPPGPGSWFLDPTHWTRPVTRFQAELFPDAFERGFGESLRRYGSLRPPGGSAEGRGWPSPEGRVGRARANRS